jgi:Ni/Co efflux regulator RcnB
MLKFKSQEVTKKKTFNDAYVKGFEDFQKGNTINPYRPRSYFWKEWERGFNASYFSNLAF